MSVAPEIESAPPRWTLSASGRPAWRVWGDEAVVHHALSNDTHRLAEPAGALLGRLADGGPQTTIELAAGCGVAPEACEAVLDALIDLDLVDWC